MYLFGDRHQDSFPLNIVWISISNHRHKSSNMSSKNTIHSKESPFPRRIGLRIKKCHIQNKFDNDSTYQKQRLQWKQLSKVSFLKQVLFPSLLFKINDSEG